MPSSQLPGLPAPRDPSSAWLFPGQGSQEVGMGRDLWEASPAARAVLDTADRVLGYPLTRLCFEGPEDDLRDTRNAQPAIFTVSLACLAAALESGAVAARPAFMAGHSLGECSALVAAGALSLEEGLRFVRERGRLMAEAGARSPGTLAAIIGLDVDAVREVCREADADVCNLNLPNQVVVGGTRQAVERAMAIARERGAQRALELNVSGAFHSRLMASAAEGLRDAVASLDVKRAEVPVIANVTAAPMAEPDDIRRELAAQVVSPVRWFESVQALTAAGIRSFTEFGPGRVLTGMVKRLAPDAALANIAKLADAGPAATRTATV